MSKHFNFSAFIANFGRIIDNEIKGLGGREAAHGDLLADEGDFYNAILHFPCNIFTVQDLLASFEKLFQRNQDIICKDQLYVENSKEFKQTLPFIKVLIANEHEMAEQYQFERSSNMMNGYIFEDN